MAEQPIPDQRTRDRPAVLYAVLVTYKRPEALSVLLKKLESFTRLLEYVIVVDNAPNETSRRIVAQHDRLMTTYLPMDENVGPAGGIAAGMEHVIQMANDVDWILLLDDDDPPETTGLVQRLWEFGRAMAVEEKATAGVGLTGAHLGRFGRLRKLNTVSLSGPIAVDYIGGGKFPIYRVEAIRSVGVFDRDLFFGFDDLDFGLRLRTAHRRLYVDGDLLRELRTTRGSKGGTRHARIRVRGTAWRRYYSTRNIIVVLLRQRLLLAALWVTVLVLGKALIAAVSKRGVGVEHLYIVARGIRDGWLPRLGRTVEPD